MSTRELPALITGGAGFIGSNLAERLLATGRKVIIFDNLSRPGVERNVQELLASYTDQLDVRVEDVRNSTAVRNTVADAGEVYHLAAQVAVTSSLDDPRADFDVNALGTLNMLEAVRSLGRRCPVIYTSTNKVYGDLPDIELTAESGRYEPVDPELRRRGIGESRPLCFRSPYGCSKGAADQYVIDYARSFGVPACVFRMSCIYGPGQCGNEDQGWLCHFLRTALDDVPVTIYGDGRQVRDALYIDDLVNAMRLARTHIDLAAGRAFNIGGGPANTISLIELIALIERLTGKPVRLNHAAWRTGDQRWFVSDTSAFEQETRWSPRVNVRDGVARMHRWLTSRLALPALPPLARLTRRVVA
jgi:CDP-paratose 2-epimerase